MPPDITFDLAGVTRCPELKPGFLDPADVRIRYMDGSDLFVGMTAVTYNWPFLPGEDVAAIWTLYNDIVSGLDPYSVAGNPVTVPVPDYLHGGWRFTTGYLTEPTGTVVGDGTKNFSVTCYNLGEGSLLTAMGSPVGNFWDYIRQGAGLRIGASQYSITGCPF